MKPVPLTCMVLLVAALILGWNLPRTGIASGSIDPVLHFGAQDEATYTREAITMALDGGWMTPTFLGRWVFEKPPLLMWLSALSMKLFGIGLLAARLPVIVAGAATCALCFAMVRRLRTTSAALAAAVMALSSQILFTMSRHSMTDILLTAAGMCAFAILLWDPDLARPLSFACFVLAAAAAIAAKSLAGVLVIAVMGTVVAIARGRWMRAILAGISALALASPWFLYNFFAHREWFLADMGYQILTVGAAGHQNTSEGKLAFYALRLVASDAIPLLLALTGIPALITSLRRRDAAAWLTASYAVIYLAAILVFRFQSEQYLCWFIPALILVAGIYSPLLRNNVATAVIILVFVLKIAMPDSIFGVSMQSGTTLAAAPPLSRYCAEHRATDLYVLGVDDEFYSAALPLHHVRYGWVDASNLVAREHPHLAWMGILVTGSEFAHLPDLLPTYRDRLRAWGLDSTQPVATGIGTQDTAALAQLIRDHPESDFLVSRAILPDPEHQPTHNLAYANNEFALLESKSPPPTETPRWTCAL